MIQKELELEYVVDYKLKFNSIWERENINRLIK